MHFNSSEDYKNYKIYQRWIYKVRQRCFGLFSFLTFHIFMLQKLSF